MGLSKLWQEFKAFAFKGNMIDLAVAVVIGTAFGAVINSLVTDVIMPSITYVTTGAQTAVSTAAHVAQETASAVGVTSKPAGTQPAETQPAAAAAAPAPPPPPPAATPAPPPKQEKPVEITWTIGRIRIGNFIGSLVNFLLVAMAVFLVIVKLLGSVMKRVGGTPGPSEPTTKECPFCLSVIPIKARKCSQCTADLPASTTVAPPPAA
jgi:large conductance mechanosensitive channel